MHFHFLGRSCDLFVAMCECPDLFSANTVKWFTCIPCVCVCFIFRAFENNFCRINGMRKGYYYPYHTPCKCKDCSNITLEKDCPCIWVCAICCVDSIMGEDVSRKPQKNIQTPQGEQLQPQQVTTIQPRENELTPNPMPNQGGASRT